MYVLLDNTFVILSILHVLGLTTGEISCVFEAKLFWLAATLNQFAMEFRKQLS